MENQLNYLKVLLLSELLLEANDSLKNSPQYRLNVKQQLSRTNVMLENIVKSEYDKVYGLDSGVEHLKALALVSRTLRDADVCMKLRNNESASTLLAILQEGPNSVAD